jgi:hypothetical protein
VGPGARAWTDIDVLKPHYEGGLVTAQKGIAAQGGEPVQQQFIEHSAP